MGEARNHPERGDQPTQPVALATTAARSALAEAGLAVDSSAVGIVCATVGSDDSPDPAGAVREARAQRCRHRCRRSRRAAATSREQCHPGGRERQRRLGVDHRYRGEVQFADGAPIGWRRTRDPQGPGADDLWLPEGEFMAEAEVAAAMWDPVTQYADRFGARSGREPLTNSCAATCRSCGNGSTAPPAPTPRPVSPLHTLLPARRHDRGQPTAGVSHNKWHSTQWALDHAVALVISAEEVALANGVAADQLVHPRVALDSSWGLSLTRRAEPHRWPMMRIMGEAAAEHLEADLSGIDATELYSCFPASVRVQQRELALAVEGTPTVLGGMPFAGGPFNHFTYMATAELARRLRSGESDLALISTVSGLLTKGGLMVWGREPDPSGALVADVAPEARAATLPQDLAPFDADRDLRADDTVVAATVTGGFDPRVFRIVDDQEGVRHVISRSAEAGEDPLAVLT
ncbi:MAG: hypothetical protein R2789_00210 [Microthrixaceae bacterium]